MRLKNYILEIEPSQKKPFSVNIWSNCVTTCLSKYDMRMSDNNRITVNALSSVIRYKLRSFITKTL